MKNERSPPALAIEAGGDRNLIEAGVYRLIFTERKLAPEQLGRASARRWASAWRVSRRHRRSDYLDD